MKNGELVRILDSYVTDDAECKIGESPKCLMVIQSNICIMINLDKEWDVE